MRPFEYIVDEHGPSILRYLKARVGPDRAEDCFQETMLSALRGYQAVKEPKAVKAWLFTIAGRKAIDSYRAGVRRPGPDDSVEATIDPRSTTRPGRNDVWDLVGQLPEKQAVAVQLRYRGGLTHREIGQVMEVSESAARRNVFEGLKRLRSEKKSWI